MEIDDEVKIAIVFALPKEAAGAEIIFEDQDKLQELDVKPGFSSSLCRIPLHLNKSDHHTVALAIPAQTGNNHSAICVTQLRNRFKNIEHIILCGIAGGAPKHDDPERNVYLGDIVVANNKDGIFQHDFGHDVQSPKIKYLLDKPRLPLMPSENFENINNSIERNSVRGEYPWVKRLNERLPLLIKMNSDFQRPVNNASISNYEKINGDETENINRTPNYDDPKVFYGGIASGNCVLKNPFRRDQLRDEHRILAVEMEAAGLAAACLAMKIDFTVVRGICDYCDSNKNNDWQYYATAAAAAYTYILIERLPKETQLITTIDGKMQSDTSQLERINMQSDEAGTPSASTTTGLEAIASSDSSTNDDNVKNTANEFAIKQNLQDMEKAEAQHDWEDLFNTAVKVENMLNIEYGSISEEVHAEALIAVSAAYRKYSHISNDPEINKTTSRAAAILMKAKEILG